MECNFDMLFDYIDGTLSDDDCELLKKHLKSCEYCKETVNTFKLMEEVGEHNYDIPINVVQKVRKLTDDNLYCSKKYIFINKYLSKKEVFKSYAIAACIILILVTGSLIYNNFNFTDNTGKLTVGNGSSLNQEKNFSTTFGLPEYIIVYKNGHEEKLTKGMEKYNTIIKILDENLVKEKKLKLGTSKVSDNGEMLKQKEISLEFVYYELSSYPLVADYKGDKKPFTKLLWTLTGESNNVFELGFNSGFGAYGSGTVGGFNKDVASKVLDVIK